MSELKLSCLYSDLKSAVDRYTELSDQVDFVDPEKSDVILVLGGDGFMLHSVHTYQHLHKPFYGMNCGSLGFLLNEYTDEHIIQKISKAKNQILFPLRMKAELKSGDKIEALAFNEVSILRTSRQTANIRLVVNGIERISRLIGDGILVATPAGSTAYNFSARGPIIPMGSNALTLTPVSPFRPRRWNGAILPHDAVIQFENLDPEKRPIYVAADFKEWSDALIIEVHEDRSKSVTLMFNPDHALDDRIFNEQFTSGD